MVLRGVNGEQAMPEGAPRSAIKPIVAAIFMGRSLFRLLAHSG
jgi:hypothetical protein